MYSQTDLISGMAESLVFPSCSQFLHQWSDSPQFYDTQHWRTSSLTSVSHFITSWDLLFLAQSLQNITQLTTVNAWGFNHLFLFLKKRKMLPYLLINLVAAIATTFLNKLSQKTGWKFNAGVLQGNSWIRFLKHKLCKQLSLPPIAGYEGIHSSVTLWVGVHISATTGELCVHHSLDINCIRQGSWSSLYNPVVWIFPPPASYKPVVHFVVFFFSGRLDKEVWLLERRLMFTANNLPVSAAEWHLLIMWL